MTYNQRVKNTLINKSKKNCCKRSEFYAFLLFNNAFTDDEIIISETDREVLDYYVAQAEIIVRHPLSISKNGRIFYCIVSGKDASPCRRTGRHTAPRRISPKTGSGDSGQTAAE